MLKILKTLEIDDRYKISHKSSKIIFAAPLWIVIIVVLLLLIPQTRDFGFWLLKENNPVEICTFLVFALGGIYGITFGIRSRYELGVFPTSFYVIFSFFLVLLAMEEIAWGQWFFKFETPAAWSDLNAQKETTLHNLTQMQENNDLLRFIYGIGGLIGIYLGRISLFKKIAVPKFLILWFLIIAFHSMLDIVVDWFETNYRIFRPIIRFNEITELLISCSALLYLYLNLGKLKNTKAMNS